MLDLLKTPKAAAISTANGDGPADQGAGMTLVPLCQILDNPYQPRGHYDAEYILNLALSIKELKRDVPATLGLQQAPLARLVTVDGRSGELTTGGRALYVSGNAVRLIHQERGVHAQLMFGHSRLRAFMVLSEGLRSIVRSKGASIGLNLNTVAELETRYAALMEPDHDYVLMPLTLGFALDHAMWRHAITENSQRKNITAIEEAQAMRRAMDEFGLSTEEAAKPFGYERSTAANKLRLLNLPKEAQALINDGTITERHGRELVRLAADPARLKSALKKVTAQGMSVRQLAADVDWKVREIEGEAADQAELDAARAALAAGWCVPGQSAPAPVERLAAKLPASLWPTPFDADDSKDMALLKGGHCGPHCACFVVYLRKHAGPERVIGPDPARAPHVGIGCTGTHEDRQTKRAAAAKDPLAAVVTLTPEERAQAEKEAERRRIVAERKLAAEQLWQTALRQMDRAGLWTSPRFWQTVGPRGIEHRLKRVFAEMTDVRTATDQILALLFAECCYYDSQVGCVVYSVVAVQGLINSLDGVSQEAAYAGIEEVFEGDEDDE